MKEIIFIIGLYKNGGVARHSTAIANELGKRGYKVTLLATKGVGEDVFFDIGQNVSLVDSAEYAKEHSDDKNILVAVSNANRKIKHIKRMLAYFPFLLSEKKKAEYIEKKRLLRRGISVLPYIAGVDDAVPICFGIDYFEIAYGASLIKNSGLIFAEKNASQVENGNDADSIKKSGMLLRNASACVFQTYDEAAYYGDYIDKDKSFVIRNPLTAGLPEPYCGERRKVIVNFCRISEQKNLILLVDSFEKVLKKHPGYKLEIYGNCVTETEEILKRKLIAYVSAKNLNESVFILPPKQNIHDTVKDCAMFVSSSDFEGLSNSMIEAMAIGMPCVCTDCLGGGAREMITDGENGLLVPVKNADALAGGIIRFIEDKALAEKCGKNAEKVRGTLSVRNIVDEWQAVIEK